MGRQPCCDKLGLKRGPWTIDEDHKLMNFILNNGIQCWRVVPKLAGLMRCGKSCRLRWINYLRPDLKKGSLTEAEENMIIQLHSCYGNRWSRIASHFPGRTDNEIKNHWNTRIKKRLKHFGLDPITHKPLSKQEIIGNNGFEYVQSNSPENQENTILVLDSNGDDNNRIPKRAGAEASESGPGENNNCFHNNEMWPSNEFSVGISGRNIFDDFQQQWTHSPNTLLSWDGFSNFDEILFNSPSNLDGTNI